MMGQTMTSSAGREWRLRVCGPVSLALWLAVAGAVVAQEVYELDDSYDWQQQSRYDPATPQGQLQAIRKALAEERPKAARDMADDWIEQHPNHPLLVEAHLLRGDALVAQKHYYDALFDYEFVIRQFPASQQYHTALEREFEIARLFASGLRRRFLGMRILPATGEAEELFIRIQERAPGSHIGEKASLALGDFYFDRAEMTAAAEAYDLFLANYPESRFRQRAMLRQIQASLATFKGPQFDSRGLLDAAERIRAYQQAYPAEAERLGAEALLLRIDESLALKTYYSASWYERTGKKVSAVYLYRRVVKDYGRTAAAQAAIQRLEALGEPVVQNDADRRQVVDHAEALQDLSDALELSNPDQTVEIK